MQEIWVPIEGAPGYAVSSLGKVRRVDTDQLMSVNRLQDGTLVVSLTVDGNQRPYVLRRLVAEAFCEVPDENSTTVIHKNGDQYNCTYENLAWRPRWHAWRYTHQFTEEPHEKFHIPTCNLHTGVTYRNVMEAGKADGVLWEAIYTSMLQHSPVYPYGHIYERADW